MSVKLFVEGYELDITTDIDVDFTYSIADITNIERRNTSYSKTIVLPSSVRNQKLLGNIFDLSVSNEYDKDAPNILSNFNSSKQAKAQVYLDNVKIFDGVLRLIKIINTGGDITYETNVFGKLNDILTILGDKTLAEIDFTDYDHIWNITNIETSWERPMWVDGANNYVYPLVDYGYSVDGITYPLLGFKPAIFVREIIKRIFKESGFELIAPLFDTDYFKKLLLLTAEKEVSKQLDMLLRQTSNGFTQFLTTPTEYNRLIDFEIDNVHNGFEISNGGTRFTWIRTNTQTTTIKFDANLLLTRLAGAGTGYVEWTAVIYLNTGVLVSDTVYLDYVAGREDNREYSWNIVLTSPITLNTGDYIEVYLIANTDNQMQIRTRIRMSNMTLLVGALVPTAIPLEEGDVMQINYVMPKSIKQKDFLKSIITMFNLYVVQNKLQDNILEFIPYNEFYYTYKDQSLDWTDKVDYKENITITPVSELSAKEYRLRFDDDTDYWSASYKSKFNQGYGESRTIMDNDFENDIKDIKVVFGAPVMREEVAGRKLVHLYKVENNVKIKDNFKPRIVFWKPNQNCPTEWRLSFSGTSNSYVQYPYAGHLDNPTIPDNDVLFGTPKEVYFNITTYPEKNLYKSYYEALLNSIGNSDSRLLEAYLYLTPIDIENLNFRKIIKINNHYFELHKIDKYNPIANSLCRVSLYKILTDLQPIDYDYILLEDSNFMLQENGISKFYI